MLHSGLQSNPATSIWLTTSPGHCYQRTAQGHMQANRLPSGRRQPAVTLSVQNLNERHDGRTQRLKDRKSVV